MEQNIELNWLGSCDINNLQEFLNQHKDKGGLYFWIFRGKQECIACIGETKNFKSRFEQHFSNALHGLYSTFDCKSEEDLSLCYSEVAKGNYDKFYTPRKTTFSNLDEQAEDIIRGIRMNISFLSNMRFVFVEMEENARIRKQIETIFMNKAREIYKAYKCLEWRSNANFWGVKSVNLPKDTTFIVRSKGVIDEMIQNEFGITDTWRYFYSKI